MVKYIIKLKFEIGIEASNQEELQLNLNKLNLAIIDIFKDFKFVKHNPQVDATKFKLDPIDTGLSKFETSCEHIRHIKNKYYCKIHANPARLNCIECKSYEHHK